MDENFVQEFQSRDSICDSYCDGPDDRKKIADQLQDATIHLAWYGYGDYCGSSLVIFEKAGKLYEVNGGHCSCCGLEGQWKPEETNWEAINMRDISGDYEGSEEANRILHEVAKSHLPEVA